MAERYFKNEMPDYIPETSTTLTTATTTGNTLLTLLSMDYNALASLMERQALDIKETVTFFFFSLFIWI